MQRYFAVTFTLLLVICCLFAACARVDDDNDGGSAANTETTSAYASAAAAASKDSAAPVTTAPTATEDTDPIIVWQDGEFERLIRMALNKPTGDIHQSEAAAVKNLVIIGEYCVISEDPSYAEYYVAATPGTRDVTEYLLAEYGGSKRGSLNDLEDLSNFPNLNTLRIIYTNVIDLSPLANCDDLQLLYLWYNQVNSVDALGGLPLTVLSISGERLSSIEPLSQLESILAIGIDTCAITSEDAMALSTLTKLQYLSLCDNELDSIRFVSKLLWLKELWLENNAINTLEGLGSQPNLEQLYLNDNALVSAEECASLGHLEILELSNNRIKDVTPLAKLRTLKRLELENNIITVLPDLSKMTELQQLWVYGNVITDLSPLEGLTSLLLLDINVSLLPEGELAAIRQAIPGLTIRQNNQDI